MKQKLILALVFDRPPSDEIRSDLEGRSDPFVQVPSLTIWKRAVGGGPSSTLLQIDIGGMNEFAVTRGARAFLFTNEGNLEAFIKRGCR